MQLSANDTPRLFVETKNSYEFTMAAFFMPNSWYVIVENPDWSRVQDIDEVIKEEYNAATEGWCVLRSRYHKLQCDILPFILGKKEYDSITYSNDSANYWLIKIKPNSNSRLLSVQQ